MPIERMIKKQGSQWILYNKKGTKILGKHSTKAGAMKQEKVIESITGKRK